MQNGETSTQMIQTTRDRVACARRVGVGLLLGAALFSPTTPAFADDGTFTAPPLSLPTHPQVETVRAATLVQFPRSDVALSDLVNAADAEGASPQVNSGDTGSGTAIPGDISAEPDASDVAPASDAPTAPTPVHLPPDQMFPAVPGKEVIAKNEALVSPARLQPMPSPATASATTAPVATSPEADAQYQSNTPQYRPSNSTTISRKPRLEARPVRRTQSPRKIVTDAAHSVPAKSSSIGPSACSQNAPTASVCMSSDPGDQSDCISTGRPAAAAKRGGQAADDTPQCVSAGSTISPGAGTVPTGQSSVPESTSPTAVFHPVGIPLPAVMLALIIARQEEATAPRPSTPVEPLSGWGWVLVTSTIRRAHVQTRSVTQGVLGATSSVTSRVSQTVRADSAVSSTAKDRIVTHSQPRRPAPAARTSKPHVQPAGVGSARAAGPTPGPSGYSWLVVLVLALFATGAFSLLTTGVFERPAAALAAFGVRLRSTGLGGSRIAARFRGGSRAARGIRYRD